MDETDRKIMELLQQDGRMEDVEIARKIGVSHDTVKRRRKKLEDAGYIKIQANINPREFGYTNVFYLGIALAPGIDVRKIAEKLASRKEFFFVALSLGPTHAIVAACIAREQIVLNKLVEELRTWKEIEKIETSIIYEVLKSGYHSIPVDTL
ncbi:MAG: Lrp/AsnC family transcriptional regulator [Candidatus Methanoperedens sp.]|nr:Lrp/AsnC family transcriptional regulator [Candidatus Methanoperedens sp.]MCZ7396036.1 Lrp/AsnC family transcriptional regulator [Candidatus Methanoperedens sp.]